MTSVVLVLWNSTLLMVDHVHFQYNGMLLGLLLLSIAAIERQRTYLGAVLFCLLLCMKHIFLYVSPVFFVYLLRFHCDMSFWPFRLRFGRLLRLGLVVLGSFLVLLAPFLSPVQMPQLLKRLFPFGRGLTHAYWAPNCWALYNTVDRVLAKALRRSGASGSTAGFAEVYESAVLWSVPPKATFALTLLAYLPLLRAIWQAPERGSLSLYVALGSAVAFSFGWHVHEKAILMVTIPLLAFAPSGADRANPRRRRMRRLAVALSTAGSFSVMPLLPLESKETIVKWILFLAGLLVENWLLLGHPPTEVPLGLTTVAGGILRSLWPFSASLWPLVALAYGVLGIFRDAGGHAWLFRGRMEFLPLMLTSDFTALLILGSFWSLFSLLPSEKLKQ
ncbi:3-glucosyltransferase (Asparagine-linked glycosylation protein 8 homolog) (Dol-P-Glc:Glc(1)Man(9)GlcNAc(2)-PP-dolichyl alpha-1 [Durusdinium trenchii]|uniref:Alpha-1,3-glucosyltransferase n=2 Tax=Durusdinium trenchii TaxID=1381693 RepID=A0ABP0R3N2_9DINO